MGSFAASSYFFNIAAMQLLLLPFAAISRDVRRIVAVCICLAGLYYVAPRLITFYVGFWLVVAVVARLLQADPGSVLRRLLLTASVVAGTAVLVLHKLYPYEFWVEWNQRLAYATARISASIGEVDLLHPIVAPLGLSYSVFRAIDLLVKTYSGRLHGLRIFDVFFYGLFPPVLITGPVIEYEELSKTDAKVGAETIFSAVMGFTIGLAKIFGASILLRDFSTLENIGDLSLGMRWLVFAVHPWYFYLNFSGYSDLAISLALLYGFHLKPNFNHPFLQSSPQAFWANWNMGLTRWAQRNVFIPLGGYRPKTQYLALLCTILAIAFWHDISWPLLVFGLYHAAALIAQRAYQSRYGATRSEDLPAARRILYTAATFLFVAASFPLLEMRLGPALGFYKALLWP